MIFFLYYLVPPLIMAIIIMVIFRVKKKDCTPGYLIMYFVMLTLGPVGFIFGLLFIKDNFTKESIFD